MTKAQYWRNRPNPMLLVMMEKVRRRNESVEREAAAFRSALFSILIVKVRATLGGINNLHIRQARLVGGNAEGRSHSEPRSGNHTRVQSTECARTGTWNPTPVIGIGRRGATGKPVGNSILTDQSSGVPGVRSN